MPVREFKWIRSRSGNMWYYNSPELGNRGLVVKESEGEYHTWGVSDTWGIYRTLREAKEKVESNVGF